MRLIRWPLLPILLIGIANIPCWYGYCYWGWNPRLSLTSLAVLGFAAGWFATERIWGIVFCMLIPVLLVGGERHGYPWEWLLYSLVFPPLILYFLMNVGPIIAGYLVLIRLGQYVRSKLLPA